MTVYFQQHGSVYWQKGADETLRNLDPSQFLHQQLATSFSVPNSPVWMDCSTSKQCKKLEEAVGGPLVSKNNLPSDLRTLLGLLSANFFNDVKVPPPFPSMIIVHSIHKCKGRNKIVNHINYLYAKFYPCTIILICLLCV